MTPPAKPLVLGLSSSPRKNGNTDSLVRAALEGASAAGADTSFLRLADLDIAPCRACYYCKKHSGCSIDDDMAQVYAALTAADAWVLGTPIYFYTLSAQLKTALDRLFAFYCDPAGMPSTGKRAAVITTCAEENVDYQAAPVFDCFEKSLPALGVDFTSRLALQGVSLEDASAAWSSHPAALALGKSLVKQPARARLHEAPKPPLTPHLPRLYSCFSGYRPLCPGQKERLKCLLKSSSSPFPTPTTLPPCRTASAASPTPSASPR